MNIRIPVWLTSLVDTFGNWSNTPVWYYEHLNWSGSKYTKPRLELRRIDLVTAALFLFCVSWYAWGYGWRGALGGGVSFLVVMFFALFCRR